MVRGRAGGTILVLAVIVLVVLANNIGIVHAAELALDGAASNTCTGSSHSATCSVTLTTSNSNDIIIAFANGECAGPVTLGTPTGSGLSFTLRKSGVALSLGEWWALATSALSSETITITESSTLCGGPPITTSFVVWGIAGANTVTPFDPNMGLPSQNTGIGASGSVSVSTSNANDMILGMVGGGANIGGGSAGPGFTIIKSDSLANAASEYEVVSSTQSALSVSINFGGNTAWEMFGDAVQAAPAPPIPEYPLGLFILAILTVIAYGLISRKIRTN